MIEPSTDGITSLCYAFEAEGVELFYTSVKYSCRYEGVRTPFSEILWEVGEHADIHKVVSFMQRMMRLGCMVELGWRDVEVTR